MDNHRMGDKICIFGRLFQGLLIDITDEELICSRIFEGRVYSTVINSSSSSSSLLYKAWFLLLV